MPTPDIQSILQFTESVMLNAFNQARRESPFDGLVLRKMDATGIRKFAVTFLPAVYRRFTGEAKPVTYDARNLTVEVVEYKNPVEIDKTQLKHARALAGDEEFMMPLRTRARDAAFAVDAQLAALLEANGNDILGSAAFASAAEIPNSDGVTVTNTRSGAGVTAANVQTDFDAMKGLFIAMQSPGGRSFHGPAFRRSKPIILCHDDVRAVMEEVFETPTLSGGGANRFFGKADIRVVPDFTDTNDWYLCNTSPAFPQFIELNDGDPDEATNFDGRTGDRDYLLRNKVLFNSDFNFEVAFGSRMEITRNVNT